jgi:hypothetical protein
MAKAKYKPLICRSSIPNYVTYINKWSYGLVIEMAKISNLPIQSTILENAHLNTFMNCLWTRWKYYAFNLMEIHLITSIIMWNLFLSEGMA